MPMGIPKTEEERKERHERIYGEESEPPEDWLNLGQKQEDLLWDLFPALPFEMGLFTLPLPRRLMRKIAETTEAEIDEIIKKGEEAKETLRKGFLRMKQRVTIPC